MNTLYMEVRIEKGRLGRYMEGETLTPGGKNLVGGGMDGLGGGEKEGRGGREGKGGRERKS